MNIRAVSAVAVGGLLLYSAASAQTRLPTTGSNAAAQYLDPTNGVRTIPVFMRLRVTL